MNLFSKLLVASVLLTSTLQAQTLTQTVKGVITDNESQSPLEGATVVVFKDEFQLGTTTDLSGKYKIERVPVGRYNIRVQFLGYEPATLNEVLVTSGKSWCLI